jgi:ribosomal protein L40E
LIILVLVIGINLVRRSRPGKAIICSNCGFKNPFTATSFCVRCGESLKRGRSP